MTQHFPRMRPSRLFPLFFPLILANCQNDLSDFALPTEHAIITDEMSETEQDIIINILSSRFNGYRKGQLNTRSSDRVSLKPYIEDGDTLLYIAQFHNGWDIYSACHSTEMLLFSSSTGVFSFDDPKLPQQLNFLIKSNVKRLRELANSPKAYIDKSWGHAAIGETEFSSGNITVLDKNGSRIKGKTADLPPGHWTLLESRRVCSATDISPKLIETQWGQSAPWNQYARWVLDPSSNTLKQCVAGCVPVAVSQYMYFTHYKEGIPLTAASNASLTPSRSDYIFSGNSSSVWDNMAKYFFDNDTAKSALLIGDVGHKLNSIYGLSTTLTSVSSCIDFLSQTYDTAFKLEDFRFDTVKESIDNGYPLLSRASSTNHGGHTFITDQYKIETNTQRYLYGLVRDPLPPGEKDMWMADKIDENGNIIEYAYTNEIFQDFHTYSVSMNWGYSGLYDDTFYYYLGNWEVGSTNYDLEHQLYVRHN